MEKLCRACGQNRPTTEFHKDRAKPDGLNAYCKPCTIAKQKEYALKPPRHVSPPGMKRCQRCKQEKPVAEFYNANHTYDGLDKVCKPCSAKDHEAWRLRNKSKVAGYAKKWRQDHPERVADHNLKKHYGLPIGAYDKMLIEQNAKCAICETTEPGFHRRFHVDHCHETKTVRGLLCEACNLGIGKLKHDPNILGKAILYLNRTMRNTR